MEKTNHTERPSGLTQKPLDNEASSRATRDANLQSSFRSLLERSDRDGGDSNPMSSLPQGGVAPSVDSFAARLQELDPLQMSTRAPGSSLPAQRAVANVDRVLAQAARDVQLASDGGDRYVLRFEVASGELQGARIAVSSAGGVVSAIAVPASVETMLRLEHALDEARVSLEERGIDVAGLEVRTGDHHGRDGCFEEEETNQEEIDNDGPRRAMRPIVDRSHGRGVDYFV